MRYHLRFIFFLALFTVFGCSSEPPEPNVQQVNSTLFEQLFSSAKFDILDRAGSLLDTPSVAITDNPSLQHLHDKRTYVSLACYWWPDPDSEDGLPYIRRDGEVNPETRGNASDLPKLIDMAQRVELLTMAYLISGDENFSAKAVDQIYTWFLNPETAMLPHLEHAQMVRGLNHGRSYGVIDTWWLIRVVEAIPVLRQSVYWSDQTEFKLQKWFTHYLNWLRNSEFGLQEKQSANNHGTWFDVQVVNFSLFVGQSDYALHHLNKITKTRLSDQIRFTGRQHREVNRPRPEHYSIYNLSGWLKLAQMADQFELKLDSQTGLLTGKFHDALVYLIRRMQDKSVADLLDPWDRTDTDNLYINLMMDAWAMYNKPVFKYKAMMVFQEVQHDGLPVLTPENYLEMRKLFSDETFTSSDIYEIHTEFLNFD